MNDLVTLSQDNQLTTTSGIVAEVFGKQHKNVIQKIKKIVEDHPDFGELNFKLSTYDSAQGKVLPCWEMTRDGFSLLAMGFTGKEADEWKIKYISAFNQMEKLVNQYSSMALQNKVQEADTKAKIEAIELEALKTRIQGRLDIAKMMNQSFDINEFLNNDKADLPTQMILDMKLTMGKEIATYGTLDLERHSLGHLLEKHGIDMTAKQFNTEYLIPNGLLDTNRIVTSKGKYFGTNDIANSKTGDTSPRWFDCRFKELLDYLNI